MLETLSFYCVKCKKKHNTNKYKVVSKKGRRFAITTHSCGIRNFRIVGKE